MNNYFKLRNGINGTVGMSRCFVEHICPYMVVGALKACNMEEGFNHLKTYGVHW